MKRRRTKLRDEVVTLAHGAGGKATAGARRGALRRGARQSAPRARSPTSALLELDGSRLAFTTDSYVVKPIFFPGGDIGDLAVNGTVNDLAVAGATPLVLSAGFVIEEGFPVADLRRIASSRWPRGRARGVPVAAGDTKVVERGKADGLYVDDGRDRRGRPRSSTRARACRRGDRVLVSGPIGDHGMAVMSPAASCSSSSTWRATPRACSSSAQALLTLGDAVRFMRDPTRGGVATALNELAEAAGLAGSLDEAALPVRPEVVGTSEILGIDPLYVACEGRLIAVVAPEACEAALALLRSHPLGAGAAIIGEVRVEPEGLVLLETSFGGSRVVDMLVGDPLPRIC